jgi:hypothetical protein
MLFLSAISASVMFGGVAGCGADVHAASRPANNGRTVYARNWAGERGMM